MDAVWNSVGSIPWYGWVAIVVIVCGAVVAAVRAKSGKRSA